MQKIEDYKTRWLSLFPSSDFKTSERTFEYIVRKYSEKHRRYHTLNHLWGCLKVLDSVQAETGNLWAIETALWFHDLFYNIFSTSNEFKSAKAAKKSLASLSINSDRISNVYDLIMSTRHIDNPVTEDQRYIMDIDLSILGTPQIEYLTYENMIRKEYQVIPGFIYRKRRYVFLMNLLNRERIYFTDTFYNSHEKTARNNIRLALDRLLSNS